MSHSINELTERLNDIFGEDIGQITKRNLQEPTPDFVQRLVFGFLQEFGFSEHMLAPNHSCLDLIIGNLNLSNDITDRLPLDILVVAVRNFLQKIEYKEINFGILDLVEPDSKRIRKFLNVFVNFWLFCNNQCYAISDRQQKVEEMAKSGKKLARERNQTLKEIEDLRQKRQTIIIQKEKIEEEKQSVDEEVANLLHANQVLGESSKEKKAELEQLKKMEECLNSKIQDLEKDKERLERLVKSDEMKQGLETQLSNLREESDGKMLKVHEIRVKVQESKTRLADFQRFLKQLQSNAEKHAKNKTLEQDIERLEMEKEEKVEEVLNLNEELGIVQQQLDEVKKELATLFNVWNKKKGCLEAEIQDYEKEIQNIRQHTSEEETAASDLEASINIAKQHNKEIEIQTDGEVQHVQETVQTLYDTYDGFNARWKGEMEKVRLCFEKLENRNPSNH